MKMLNVVMKVSKSLASLALVQAIDLVIRMIFTQVCFFFRHEF